MGNSWWLKANPRGILLGVCDEARVEHRARRLGSPRGLGDSRGLCHRWCGRHRWGSLNRGW